MAPFSHSFSRAIGILLGGMAAVEAGAALYVLLVGRFSTHLGPIPIAGGSATKLVAISVLLAGAAIWWLEPLQSDTARSRLAKLCIGVAWGAVAAGFVPLLAPFFLPDFLFAHDGAVHQTYAYLFDRALRQGQVPVRWVEGLAAGQGQPLFNYYQVGFYYLISLVHAFGPGLSLSLKLAIALAWIGGAGFTFLWLTPYGRLPALLGASLFAWAPYLMVDGYVRTAYPELMGVALAPAVLWSADRLLRTGRTIFICTTALSTGLLLITHLPASLIVAPFCAAYTFGAWLVYRPPARRLGLIVLGAAIGVGVAAFYVFPSILELGDVKIDTLTSDYFHYRRHFVRPGAWLDWSWGYAPSGNDEPNLMSVQIGIVQCLVILAAIAGLLLLPFRWPPATRWALAGGLAAVAVSLFMMTAASGSIWSRVAPLSFIQFPWRFLMIPAIVCSALAAALLSAVSVRTTQALVVICAVALQWSVTRDYRSPAWTRERAVIAIDNPHWAASANGRHWAFREPGYDPIAVTRDTPIAPARWAITAGHARVVAIAATDVRLSLRVEARESVDLLIATPSFPGWRIAIDEKPVAHDVQPGSAYLGVRVPAGAHGVDVRFRNTPLRTAANTTTLVSLLVVGLLLGWSTGWIPKRLGVRRNVCLQ
jgi:hypothetical protein